MRQRIRNATLEIWLPVLLVALWWWLSSDSESLFFPPLEEILGQVREAFLSSQADENIVPSLAHLFAGFAVASIAGVVLGVVLGVNRWVRAAVEPLVHFLRALPAPALLPFAIIAFGIGSAMKIWVIAFTAFFPILLNTIDGVRGRDPATTDVARAYRVPRGPRFARIVIPAAMPQIFAGLRVGLQTSLLLMVVSELVASTGGIGFVILQSQQVFATATMWAGIVVLGVLGYLLNWIFGRIELRVLDWYFASHEAAVR
jgi:ABC-type nitrate/sulfonate/bicarbonate transport system permease component